mmetsp:Transcript_45515/g.120220  ORF Transcript_45515/g.120220 Transcript_45515/m.120220 type:complete len:225 (-) Transcript_45515:496-1170(-)
MVSQTGAPYKATCVSRFRPVRDGSTSLSRRHSEHRRVCNFVQPRSPSSLSRVARPSSSDATSDSPLQLVGSFPKSIWENSAMRRSEKLANRSMSAVDSLHSGLPWNPTLRYCTVLRTSARAASRSPPTPMPPHSSLFAYTGRISNARHVHGGDWKKSYDVTVQVAPSGSSSANSDPQSTRVLSIMGKEKPNHTSSTMMWAPRYRRQRPVLFCRGPEGSARNRAA